MSPVSDVPAHPSGSRDAFVEDPHLPRYHFVPPNSWLNDPNALIQWDGQYHLFYGRVPPDSRRNGASWGHATSGDLLTWRDRSPALEPTEGIDGDGCRSGCAVDDDGTPTVLYTGTDDGVDRQLLATSDDDDLETWTKADEPLIAEPPPALGDRVRRFGDPFAWREDGEWHMLLGADVDGSGRVLRYRSEDLRDWEFVGTLGGRSAGGATITAGEGGWERPGLVRFDEADLLYGSTPKRRAVEYRLGTLGAGDEFETRARGQVDHGDLYAPRTMHDEAERTLLWGWLDETRPRDAVAEAGWSGALSLPRVLDVDDGDLRQRPAPELRELRNRHCRHAVDLGNESVLVTRGRSIELALTITREDASSAGLHVLRSPDGSETTTIIVDFPTREVVLDRRRASTDDATARDVQRAPLPEDGDDDRVVLHVFVDGSVVETLVDYRTGLTSRVYPTGDRSDGVSLFARGGDAQFDLDVWTLGGLQYGDGPDATGDGGAE